jgi:transposase
MQIASIGIDLGKTTFHLVAVREHNKVSFRKKFSRAQLLAYTAKIPSALIGTESCAGSHFLGRSCESKGTKYG